MGCSITCGAGAAITGAGAGAAIGAIIFGTGAVVLC